MSAAPATAPVPARDEACVQRSAETTGTSCADEVTAAPAQHRRSALFATLVNERRDLDPAARAALVEAGAFTFVDRTWVTLWYDADHAVSSHCGGMTAYRAITSTGDLLWYVAPAGEAPVYHASCADPYEAIEHATVALGAQGDLNRRWAHIERLARDLRRGAVSFDVTLADTRTARVCPPVLRAAIAGASLFGAPALSGRIAAILMRHDAAIGHVIHAAWMRAQQVPDAPARKTVRVPAGFESIC